MYCLTCFYASPLGSVFCARCGRGFGGRVCTSGHKNPSAAKFCATCRKPEAEMSEATAYVSVATLSRLIAWALMLTCLGYIVHHPGAVACELVAWALWLAAHALGTTQCSIVTGVYRIAAWLAVIYAASFVMPGGAGQFVRRGMASALSRLPRALWAASHALWLLVSGQSSKDSKDKQKD